MLLLCTLSEETIYNCPCKDQSVAQALPKAWGLGGKEGVVPLRKGNSLRQGKSIGLKTLHPLYFLPQAHKRHWLPVTAFLVSHQLCSPSSDILPWCLYPAILNGIQKLFPSPFPSHRPLHFQHHLLSSFAFSLLVMGIFKDATQYMMCLCST